MWLRQGEVVLGRGADLRDDDPVGQRRGLRARPQGGRHRRQTSSTMMNAKARELGMNRSTFRSPNGFPPPSRRIADGDLTTPRDYALLCRYLVLHTDILKYTSVKNRAFGAGIRLEAAPDDQPQPPPREDPGRRRPEDRASRTARASASRRRRSATAAAIIVVMMDSPDPRTRDLNVQGADRPGLHPPSRWARSRSRPGARGRRPRPTRPSPTPSPTDGPVIHMPRPGGN